jgi:hypothetical protein
MPISVPRYCLGRDDGSPSTKLQEQEVWRTADMARLKLMSFAVAFDKDEAHWSKIVKANGAKDE